MRSLTISKTPSGLIFSNLNGKIPTPFEVSSIMKDLMKPKSTTLGVFLFLVSVLVFGMVSPLLIFLSFVGLVSFLIVRLSQRVRVSYDFSLKENETLLRTSFQQILSSGICLVDGDRLRQSGKMFRVDGYYLPLLSGDNTFLFLGDRLVVSNSQSVSWAPYSQLSCEVSERTFRLESSPRDSEVVSTGWKYETKSGDPDRRFKENPKMFDCKFGVIEFKVPHSDKSILRIEVSNPQAAWYFHSVFQKLQSLSVY